MTSFSFKVWPFLGAGYVNLIEFVEVEHQETSVEIFEKFTWKIENFSRLNVEKIYSESLVVGGCAWSFLLYQQGTKETTSYQFIWRL